MSSDIYPIGSIQKNQIISISESMLANKTINKIRNIDKLLFESNVEKNTDKELLALLTKEELEYLKPIRLSLLKVTQITLLLIIL